MRAAGLAALALLVAGCGDDAAPRACDGRVPGFATPGRVTAALHALEAAVPGRLEVLSLAPERTRATASGAVFELRGGRVRRVRAAATGPGFAYDRVDAEAPARLIRAADVRDADAVARVTLTGFSGRLVWGVSYRDGDLVTGDGSGRPTAPTRCG
jgi:hypothetical protein